MGLFKNIFGSGSSSDKKSSAKPTWLTLNSIAQLDEIDALPENESVVLFKHSTRCSISTMAQTRLEGSLAELMEKAQLYYLDLIAHRDISNEIANRYGITHESPQVIILQGGKPIFHVSHNGIKPAQLLEVIGS